jgi:hypothetical protein
MKENEAAVARGCSAYSLAGAYSDPINNEPAGKENEGEGYDQVIYQQQHTSDKDIFLSSACCFLIMSSISFSFLTL